MLSTHFCLRAAAPLTRLIGIVETKLRQASLDSAMKRSLPVGWCFTHNAGTTVIARIVVAWDSQVSVVNVLFSSDQMVMLAVEMDLKKFVVSVIYGHNQASARQQLWDDIKAVSSLVGTSPWILLGDFNAIRWHHEKSDCTHFDVNAANDFNRCLDAIGMEELNSSGLLYTWSNKRVGVDHCSSRLDRALVNTQWLNMFTESAAVVLVLGISDHSPIVVSILPYKGGKKPFKFFNFWLKHDKFQSILSQSWSLPVDGVVSPWSILYAKLRRLKPCLRGFNKQFYSDIQNKVVDVKKELSAIQTLCANKTSDPILIGYAKLWHFRSQKVESWFLNNAAAALGDCITMVFTDPSFNQSTGPYLDLSLYRFWCGIVPRSNILPITGHPVGPGGLCLVALFCALVHTSRRRRGSRRRGSVGETLNQALKSNVDFIDKIIDQGLHWSMAGVLLNFVIANRQLK
ncbi:hypothetical protein Vadar_004941 [Vaccinium darrowii]|uniref:Uncharacterized protein n=1 Tax=Vaccinium darrowii TaxID=229202 RepID=A0ACB7YKF4_9ERIC|nr:hypothetical protein Vadar_004941 [Vaccinium darrowii]